MKALEFMFDKLVKMNVARMFQLNLNGAPSHSVRKYITLRVTGT